MRNMLLLDEPLVNLLQDPSTPETLTDLGWLLVQEKVNSQFHKRRVPFRFTCRWISGDVMEVKNRAHVLAVYVKSVRRLYRVEGSLILQYKMVERAINEVFK